MPSRLLADGSPLDPPPIPGEPVVSGVRGSNRLRRLGLLDRESGMLSSTVTGGRLARGDKWDARLACGTSTDEPVATAENE